MSYKNILTSDNLDKLFKENDYDDIDCVIHALGITSGSEGENCDSDEDESKIQLFFMASVVFIIY